jgi:phosphate:Na+ symporter
METLINIIGGVALLLWGIRMVRTGITRAFGAGLRRALSASSKNRVTAAGAGIGVTALLQSSTATTLIITSFAGQGLIGGVAALAIVLGADVGSTMVVQALSMDLDILSPILIAIGVFLFLSSDNSKRRAIARAFTGLGLMLLSLKLIGLASVTLRESEVISVLVTPMTAEPILAIMVAALITWASHSSVAVVLLIMSLASIQVISIHLALAMVLGANLGGGMIAMGLTAGAAPIMRRIPLGNLVMRASGVALALPVLAYVQPYLAMLGDSPERMIANFHTGFNLALLLVFLPLLALVHSICCRVFPESPSTDDPGSPMYLDANALDTPSVALTAATRETLRMGDAVKMMLEGSRQVLASNDASLRKTIEASDDIVDQLNEAIKLYLTELTREELDKSESQRSVEILSFTTNLEHVGDIVDKNLMELAGKKIKGHINFSAEGQNEIDDFHDQILQTLDLSMHVFVSSDREAARQLLDKKVHIRNLELKYTETHFRRISERQPDSLDSSAMHLDVLRDLKRINSHLTSAAYPLLERDGALAKSRLLPDDEEALPTDAAVKPTGS